MSTELDPGNAWTGRCPHCQRETTFHPRGTSPVWRPTKAEAKGRFRAGELYRRASVVAECPGCGLPVHVIFEGVAKTNPPNDHATWSEPQIIHPRPVLTAFAPAEVPPDLKRDFDEAVSVLPDSSQSSANLARRVLQEVLISRAGSKRRASLEVQIEQAVKKGKVPSWCVQDLTAIRGWGNAGAHVKHDAEGGVIRPSQEQAKFLLDALHRLFLHFYVMEARATQSLADLENAKGKT